MFSKPLAPDFIPPSPDAILFDWDGTLVDSLATLKKYYDYLSGVFGLAEFSLEDVKANMRYSARDNFARIFGDQAERAHTLFYEYVEAHHLDHISLIEGAGQVVEVLRQSGIPCGVVSNKRHDVLIKEIETLGWGDVFVANVGAGRAPKDKPAPDPLLLAASLLKMDVDQSTIWYVGDSETDMMASIDAKMFPVFMKHGLRRLEDCNKISIFPYSLNNFEEFIRLVEK